jgi:pyruvate/2-oxoglutarate dehydrogenase complex dihydrolipoamide dehydrogenase (E3) component
MENISSAQVSKKTDPEEYDVVVLGSGAGGKLAAWTLAQQGKRVAVIERKYIGGSCPNIACLPSKNIVHSAKVASYLSRRKEFGIVADGFTVDMSTVRDRKRRMVSDLINIHLDNYKRSGAELILGSGRFLGPRTLEATLPDGTRRLLRGSNVIIGTGTHAALEPIPDLAEAQPLTHIEAVASGFTEKGVLAMNPVRHVKTDRFSRTEGKTTTFIDGERPTDSPEFNEGRPTI